MAKMTEIEVDNEIRKLAAAAMGVRSDSLHVVEDMFPDLFDLGHGDAFDALCEGVARRFNLPSLAPDDFEGVFTFGEFVSMIYAKLTALGRSTLSGGNDTE